MNIPFLFAAMGLLVGASRLDGQTKPQFSKPVQVFDINSMMIARPSAKVTDYIAKLHAERGLNETVSAVTDKNGMIRLAFLPADGEQSNCTQYADCYFDKKEKWISTEEYFVVSRDSAKGVGAILVKMTSALKAKNFEIGSCLSGGGVSVWRITTPANTWYECEIFKKGSANTSLVVPTEKAPYLAPNPSIYGTAYFDKNGMLVKIQAKSKVKELNPDLTANTTEGK